MTADLARRLVAAFATAFLLTDTAPMPELHGQLADAPARSFMTTRWTVVLQAASWDATAPGASSAAQAMTQLCQAYWYPLYAYVRRCGYPAADAEDLTQEFFATLLGKEALADVDRRKGKFRHFLLAAMKHFIANQRDRARALKRGGGQAILSLNRDEAETRYSHEPSHAATPEKGFQRQWALTVLQQVLDRLKAEFVAAGKDRLFEALKGTLAGGEAQKSYQAIAADLGTTEGTIKVMAYRLRRRYRQLLCEEIAETVATPQEVQEEIRDLIAAVSQ
jgi:RNA polymerase sigma factor (sigma-70 family)